MAEKIINNLNDNEILSLIKKGNQLAFTQLYNKYWKKLFSFAYNILNEKQLAENVLHEVFTSIWVKKEAIEITDVNNYLFVSVRNKCISLLKKVTFTDFDENLINTMTLSHEGEDNLAYKDLKRTIESSLEILPKRCRDIFVMSRFKGYSNSEIAEHYKISNRTVENQLSTALKHIRLTIAKIITFLF